MAVFTSPHFHPIDLESVFNIKQDEIPDSLRATTDDLVGSVGFRGIPFKCGFSDQKNVILLDDTAITIDVNNIKASYILFAHAIENRDITLPPDLADFNGQIPIGGSLVGNQLGDLVSEYQLQYDDGTLATTPINRRFAIQQSLIAWGASPFMAKPATSPFVMETGTESYILNKRIPEAAYSWRETRLYSGRDLTLFSGRRHLWIYALVNPNPEKLINRIACIPKNERSVIYAVSYTTLESHPLRVGNRQKIMITLPENTTLNALGEIEDVAVDLGTIISARAHLAYDREAWLGENLDVQPVRSNDKVIIEYAAHPMARLYIGNSSSEEDNRIVYDLSQSLKKQATLVTPATRPVLIRITENSSKHLVPVRIHLHGTSGEYLPPRGHHRKVNPFWFEDNYGEFVNNLNQYAYISGECIVDLPLGEVFIEISRGYEVKPLRTSFIVEADTTEVSFEMERVLHWREAGWVSADTHVHFLSPQTALLEGQAEGVNVVNLLASQWGEMFSNVADFDGNTTITAANLGGNGEYVVRVGTENRTQVMGHISLLGYTGAMIQPLASGGPSESAVGDPLEVTMADWAQRCIDQNGIVVMPHAPNPQGERAADIVLGLVHAIEMMTFNPFYGQISPYGLVDWYRFLNLGYQIPVVGGSDKMSASSLLGGIRTYVELGDRPFSYQNWMAAIKEGNTFVTVGPLVKLQVEGKPPGKRLDLPIAGGHVTVDWQVESAVMPVESIEVVVGGLAKESIPIEGKLSASGSLEIQVRQSTWIALRVRGSYKGNPTEIAAHTSAVQVVVNQEPLFSESDAFSVLEQIEGVIAYVDTLATRPDAVRYKKVRLTLEAAYNRMHQRLHRQGVYHKHTPVYDHRKSEES